MKNKNNLLIVGALLLLVVLSFSYVSYSTKINQSSTSTEYVNWNVGITNIEVFANGEAEDNNYEYKEGTLVIRPILRTPEDSINYKVTIKNSGTIPAKLGRYLYNEKNKEGHIVFTYISPKEELLPGEETVAELFISPSEEDFIEGETYTNDITAIYEYIQK